MKAFDLIQLEETAEAIKKAIQTKVSDESIKILKEIKENLELERKRWERSNPIDDDEPIYDWSEATISPGYRVKFIYNVPEGKVFYFEYLGITYNPNSVYHVWIDGVYQPQLSDVLQDFGDHRQIFKPPKIVYNKVEIWATNIGVSSQTYSAFIRGFNRWYRKVK